MSYSQILKIMTKISRLLEFQNLNICTTSSLLKSEEYHLEIESYC
ncbi:hypothetical protein LDVICp042 [lymphocystis disease virus-China]|uniref:Uncharacterized protein n=1 Tax=lymphocystis disease virus-China TaxID=256729 RepID=Q678G8_9VIRU|nr:hypothetical protein LDVICp042 [lymphocystis disease virus-China]AAU10889.1 hypothetical protein [lymphocystis disease virus-China]